jgi:hypothetical protein
VENAYGPLGVAAVVLIATPSPSAGQSAADPPKLTAGFGAGYGTSALHDDASGPTWEGTVRVRMNRWFGIEAGAGGLRTTATISFFNLSSYLPDGSTGTIERLDTRTTSRTDWIGVNALVMPSFGRVTLSGGGGLALGLFDRDYTQAGVGCSPNLAAVCQEFTNEHNSGGIRVQGLGGVDVALGSRWAAYGVARFAILDGYVETSVAAGVRFVLRAR